MATPLEDKDLFDSALDDEFGDSMDLSNLNPEDLALDDADLSSFGNIDTEIPLPHVRVYTKEFQNYLRIAKMFTASSGRDMVSKSISFSVEDGKLVCRTTDYDSYLSYYFEPLNDENILDQDVVIPIDILQKLTKASPAQVAIIRDDDTWKMRIAGGDIVLETLAIPKEKFILKDEFTKLANTDAPSLLQTLRSFTPIIQAAVTPSERRIVFKNKKAIASYMWALVTSPGDYPDTEMKVKDVQILKPLILNQEGEVTISTNNGEILRTMYSMPHFQYSTLTSTIETNDQLLNQLEESTGTPGVYVDLIQLFKMVELSADLPYSTGKIGLNYGDDGITLSIKTKKGKDSIFSLSGSTEGRTSPLEKELIMQSKLLRVLLRTFNGSNSVKLSLSDKGLCVETELLQAACFTEGN